MQQKQTKPILDVACGGKMFYFDKNDPRVLFCDKRKLHTTLCDGRTFEVKPDVIADFTQLPFSDNTFKFRPLSLSTDKYSFLHFVACRAN